jgi:hypothetical protein
MLEPGGEMDLPLEPLRAYACSHFGRQDLDDDQSAQTGLLGEEKTRLIPPPPSSRWTR